MSSVLANSQSKPFPTFASDEGGKMEFGHFKIIQALAEAGGYGGVPEEAGPLATPAEPVLVLPRAGASGAISLPAFTNGQAAFTAPVAGPEFHGARSVSLSAPEANADPIYYSTDPWVRPLGASGVLQEAEQVSNGAFTSNLNGWTGSTGDPGFYWESGKAKFFYDASGLANDIVGLQQTISGLVVGAVYRVSAVISAHTFSEGGHRAELVINEDVLAFTTGDATLTGTFVASDTSVTLFIRSDPTQENNVEATFLTDSVSLKREYAAAGKVGTPLLPGDTHILTFREVDLTRGFYIVPIIGAAADSHAVIGTYHP